MTGTGRRPRVGIVGGGQLAQMAQQEAVGLGVELVALAASDDEPAVRAGARRVPGAPDDAEALRALAAAADVVTFDHELVPPAHLEALVADGHPVRPGPDALRHAQDKLLARRSLGASGFPVPPVAPAPDAEAVAAFAAGPGGGWPVVLKARTGGYDGRGVEVAGDAAQAAQVLARGGEWLVERHVDLAAELAVLVARRPSGDAVVYPAVGTVQRDGICVEVVLPAPVEPALAAEAAALAGAIAERLDVAGMLAVELFVDRDGRLTVNELALRPHNSGHLTIEACTTSQFANHLRGVLDLPLGAPDPVVPAAAMVNVLGPADGSDPADRLAAALAVPDAHVHLYGKAARPGRKLGHVTVVGERLDEARARAHRAADALTGVTASDG